MLLGLLLAAVYHAPLFGQPGWEYQGLEGRVKVFTHVDYTVRRGDDGKDTTHIYRKSVTEYDSRGHLVRMETWGARDEPEGTYVGRTTSLEDGGGRPT